MRLSIPIIALALAASPAMAQQAQVGPADLVTAQSKTIQELTNAWTSARAAYEAEQRERIAAQGELASLKARAAIPAPPGMGVATPGSAPSTVPPSPATEVGK